MKHEKVIEIRFNPEKASRGIVQRNEFLVGEWEEDCFIHPANQQELESAAEEAVRSAFPTESFASNTLRIFTCPAASASRFVWDWSKQRAPKEA